MGALSVGVRMIETMRNLYAEAGEVVADLSSEFRTDRLRRGLSIRQAAAQMDVAPSSLCRLEGRKGAPNYETILAVLAWLSRG